MRRWEARKLGKKYTLVSTLVNITIHVRKHNFTLNQRGSQTSDRTNKKIIQTISDHVIFLGIILKLSTKKLQFSPKKSFYL